MIDYRNIREGKNCVVWTRVSTKYQEDNGGSLETQKKLCEEYANRNGYQIVKRFGGKHESAKTPGPMVKEMYNYVKKNEDVSTILVSEFDRLSRCGWQASKIIDEMREIGVIIIAAKYGLDTRTKEGVLMAKNSVNMAEWDNQNRTDKFSAGRDDCMLSGAWCQKAPFGYYKEGKSRDAWCYLNKEGKMIRSAFKWKLEGLSNSEVLDKLSARGVNISKQTLHKILVNPFYAGKICNKYTKFEMIDGQIEPAVTYEEFLKVQDILAGRTGKYTQAKHKPNFPLNKHVICIYDNTHFTSYTKMKTSKTSCHYYDYYKCNMTGCKTNVTAAEMHEKYEVLLKQYNLSEEMLSEFTDLLNDIVKDYSKDVTDQSTLLKRKMKEIDADLKKIRVRYATGTIDAETYEIAMKEFNSRRDLITLEMDKVNIDLSNLNEHIPEVISTASNISTLWHDGNLETKRRIQNLVFPDGIFWDKQISDYRTISRNGFFDLLDRFSVSYGNKKKTTSTEVVPLCG